jgi:5-methylcytosine-specific restriction endonuclease McrA
LCQICFNGGVFLNAHHIFPYAKYPEHRLNINNLITLCVGCHRFVHSVLSMKKSA